MSYFHSEISIPSNSKKKLRLDAHDNMENDYTFTFPAQTGENNSIMVIDVSNAASWTKDISINDISAVNFDISYVNANFIDVSAMHATNVTASGDISGSNVTATSDVTATNINIENISLSEKESSAGVTSGKGQLWVKNSDPNELYFTNDAGNDVRVTRGTTLASFPSSITTQSSTGWVNISGATSIMIKACGGGGGGGGSGLDTTDGDAGGGGGSGEYVEIYLNSSQIGSNTHIYCDIGAGGTSGGTGQDNGGNGATTTIKFATSGADTSGTIIATVNGGNGGIDGNDWGKGGIGGSGGSITTGTGVYLPGRNGDQGHDAKSDSQILYSTGGNGGDSHLGRGGLGANGTADAPTTEATGFGMYGGGGGGGVVGNGSNYSSSAGASGVVIVFIY